MSKISDKSNKFLLNYSYLHLGLLFIGTQCRTQVKESIWRMLPHFPFSYRIATQCRAFLAAPLEGLLNGARTWSSQCSK